MDKVFRIALSHNDEAKPIKIGLQNGASKAEGFYLILFFLFGVSLIEGADMQLLPATFRSLEVTLAMSPSRLATLGLCQALAQSLSAPAWGSLADHGYQRKWLLAAGAFSWGCITVLLAFTPHFAMMLFLRACNGVALGTLIPLTQSLIVDLTEPSERGFYFGCAQFAFALGIIFCSLFATTISNMTIWGLYGWRVAFLVVGCISLFFALLLLAFMPEPRRRTAGRVGTFSLAGELRRYRSYWRIGTFKVIVAQGVCGVVPGSALAFLIMYFQYLGMSDFLSSALFALNIVAMGIGGILGGSIGDRLSVWSPNHGRPLAAQISVASGIPLVIVLLVWIPRDPSYWNIYASVLFSMGVLSSWCGPGVKKPILSELVQEDSKASIMALDTALEGSSSAMFGAPLVGLFSETLFRYQPTQMQISEMSRAQREANAAALSSAMLCCTVLPWVACFIFFSVLHMTYGADVAAAKEEREGLEAARVHASGIIATQTTSLL